MTRRCDSLFAVRSAVTTGGSWYICRETFPSTFTPGSSARRNGATSIMIESPTAVTCAGDSGCAAGVAAAAGALEGDGAGVVATDTHGVAGGGLNSSDGSDTLTAG